MIFPESVRERAAAALLGGRVGSSLLGWGRPSSARGWRRGCHRAGVPTRGSGNRARSARAEALGVPGPGGLRRPRPSLELYGSTHGPLGNGQLCPTCGRAARTNTGIAAGPRSGSSPAPARSPQRWPGASAERTVFAARQLRVVASYLLSLKKKKKAALRHMINILWPKAICELTGV